MNKNRAKGVTLALAYFLTMAFGISGCADIEYNYDVPESQTDCPSGMIYRDSGPNIVDRDGGANIRDRDGNDVNAYCEEADCPGGNWSLDPPIIDWHLNKGKHVVANRKCLALPR